MEKIREFNN